MILCRSVRHRAVFLMLNPLRPRRNRTPPPSCHSPSMQISRAFLASIRAPEFDALLAMAIEPARVHNKWSPSCLSGARVAKQHYMADFFEISRHSIELRNIMPHLRAARILAIPFAAMVATSACSTRAFADDLPPPSEPMLAERGILHSGILF